MQIPCQFLIFRGRSFAVYIEDHLRSNSGITSGLWGSFAALYIFVTYHCCEDVFVITTPLRWCFCTALISTASKEHAKSQCREKTVSVILIYSKWNFCWNLLFCLFKFLCRIPSSRNQLKVMLAWVSIIGHLFLHSKASPQSWYLEIWCSKC